MRATPLGGGRQAGSSLDRDPEGSWPRLPMELCCNAPKMGKSFFMGFPEEFYRQTTQHEYPSAETPSSMTIFGRKCRQYGRDVWLVLGC
jgi:hypothetical protein